jgi:hypothetical protein
MVHRWLLWSNARDDKVSTSNFGVDRRDLQGTVGDAKRSNECGLASASSLWCWFGSKPRVSIGFVKIRELKLIHI